MIYYGVIISILLFIFCTLLICLPVFEKFSGEKQLLIVCSFVLTGVLSAGLCLVYLIQHSLI